MAQPAAYVPATDFSDDEVNAVSGRSTVRTANVDAEFSALQTTIAQIRGNLALVQRDDTLIKNAVVHPLAFDAASLALMASITWTVRGAWVTATAYVLGDLVQNGVQSYVCAVAHTSGTFATDYTAAKWVDLSGTTASAVQSGSGLFAVAGGTASAMTAAFSPPITLLTDGMELHVRAVGRNTIDNPTLNVDGLGAKIITRFGGLAIGIGDIAGAAHAITLRYRQSTDKFELLAGATQLHLHINVADYGAVFNGSTDDYTAIMSAMGNDRTVHFPDGTYIVGTRLNLTAYTNLVLTGTRNAIIKQKNASNLAGLITLGADSLISGITVDQNKANNTSGTDGSLRPHAINLAGNNSAVNHCIIKNVANAAAIAICNTTSSTGGPINCRASGNFITAFAANGVDNLYSNGALITDNNIYNDDTEYSANAGSGIQWWGGDAATESIATTVDDLVIVGNSVRGVAYGGIWGSQGKRITVTGNSSRACRDVGIDFEGGSYFTCSGNTVADCVNGGITTFYGAKHGSITGNQVTIDASSGLRYGIAINFNNDEHYTGAGSVDIIHKNIAITGNQISSTITSTIRGGVYVGLQSQDILIDDNGLFDCRVDLYRTKRLKVSNNKMVLDGFGTTSVIGVQMDGVNDSEISFNELRRTTDVAGNSSGITLSYGSAVWTGTDNRITGNTIIGWVHSIYDSIMNGGSVARTAIENNRVTGTIRRYAGNGWAGNSSNNRDYTNPSNVIPMEFSTAPTSDRPTYPTTSYVQTSDATVTTLATFTLPDNTAVFVRAYVNAGRDDMADRAAYVRSAFVVRDGGSAAIQGSVTSDFEAESAAALDCTIDVTGNTARVRVTGQAGVTYNWNGKFDVT